MVNLTSGATHLTFPQRLSLRRRQLWNSRDANGHSPAICAHETRTRSDSLERWKCCPLWQRKLSNKLNAKEFVNLYGIPTAELIWSGSRLEDLPFSKLPDTYVVKLMNGSGSRQTIPMYHGVNLISNEMMSNYQIRDALQQMLQQINDADNSILVETFVGDAADGLPLDYKFFCFHGRVQVIYTCERPADRISWYDRRWGLISDPMHTARPRGKVVSPPKNLGDLILTAEKLAAAYEFPFVRVDLYNPNGSITFGEFEHTPLGNELEYYTPYAGSTLAMLWDDPDADFSAS